MSATTLSKRYPPMPQPVRVDLPTAKPVVMHARVVDGAGGGPDKTILRSCAHEPSQAYRMFSAYLYPAGNRAFEAIEQSACRLGTRLHAIPESGAIDLAALRDMLELCRRQRVNIFHAHDYKSGLFGLMLKRLHPMKVVTTVHGFGQTTARTRWYFRLERTLLRFYDHVLAVSSELYDQCLAHRVEPRRLTYVPNAINLADYTPDGSATGARLKLGVDRHALVLAGVGRLSAEKGFDQAIRSLPHLPDAVQLHLIGDGPEREALGRLAQAIGVEGRVVFHGWQRDLKLFYQAMDVLLLSSLREGLPNVVLEAMAMGVPVAATPVGGVRDLLDEGRCGVMLGDHADDWPGQLHPLLTDATLRQRYARDAQQRVTDHFGFDRRMDQVLHLYDQLAA